MYNYIEEMKSDIKDYLRQNYENHKDEKGKYVFKESELDRRYAGCFNIQK